MKTNDKMTVEKLIKRLKKLPGDHEIQIDVDQAYTSYIRNIYIDQYEKNKGNKVVLITV